MPPVPFRSVFLALGIICGSGGGVSAQINASVTVDTTNRRARVSDTGFGIHTSPYYNHLGNSQTDERLEEAGVTTLRYGGGGYADVLHWSIAQPQWVNGITGGGLSPWWGTPGNFGYVGPGSDFASFVRLLDRTDNSRAVVNVNYGSALKLVNGESVVPDFGGQPQEAAAWVAYANADPAIYGTPNDVPLGFDEQGNDWKTAGYWARLRASTGSEYQSWAAADGVYEPLNRFLAIDRDAGVGIQHWEIGNEVFGNGYYNYFGSRGFSVDYDVPYDGTVRDDNPALSPRQYGEDVVEYAQLMRAVDPTIKIGAAVVTPVDYRWAFADLNDNGRKESNEPYWNDELLDAAKDELDFVALHWYPHAGTNADGSALLNEIPARFQRMIEGATPGLDLGDQAGLRDSLAFHGISDVEIQVTEFNYMGSLNPQVEDAVESLFVADAYASWLELGVESVQYLELLTKDFLSDSSSLDRGSAFYGIKLASELASPGDQFVSTESTEDAVRTHAVVQADGSVAVMLINTSLNEQASVALDLGGIAVTGDGVLYALTGGTAISQQTLSGLGGPLVASVAPREAQVFVLETLAGDFNFDGTVDAADYTVWRDGLGTVYEMSHYDVWRTNFGSSIATASSGGVAVPEPLAVALALLACAGCSAASVRSRPAP